jgi:hypothetical protein
MNSMAWRIVVVVLTSTTLVACGISPDLRPRDIDPDKQELLLPSTTFITAPDISNP